MDLQDQQGGMQQSLMTSKPKRTVDYKIVLLGESSVGKSSILERLQNNSFNENKSSTIGAAFISKKIINDGDLINLQIWDTAGQERFHNLTPLYYRNSNVAIIVFDMVNFETFKKAEYWINELDMYMGEEGEHGGDEGDDIDGTVRNSKKMNIILVGNKCDLLEENQDCAFDEKIREFITKHTSIVKYFKTSAKANIEILELFEYITNNIDQSLFHGVDEEDKTKKGLINLNFGGHQSSNSANSCQC